MAANQASLWAAEGLQIRGLARQAASITSKKQSNQKQNRRSVAKKVTGIKVTDIAWDASPSTFTTKTMEEDNGGSNELKQRIRTFAVSSF